MFGYVNIDKQSLTKGEYGLWHTFLCGICLSTKQFYGNKARLISNFDANFFNVFFHSVANKDVKIEMQKCVASPFKERSILQPDEITDKLATANVMLMYINCKDDVLDEKSLKKKIVLNQLQKPYEKAREKAPNLDRQLNEQYDALRVLEKKGCDNIDQVCHYSAVMLSCVAKYVLGNDVDEDVLDLCYNVGKWIYLIDALDDLKKDNIKHNYNPLIAWLKNYKTEKKFITENYEQLEFIFFATLNKIATCFNDLNLTMYVCILKNIIYKCLRQKTLALLDKYSLGEEN